MSRRVGRVTIPAMTQIIEQRELSSGLTMVAEPMSTARSVSLTLLVPGGVAKEPADQLGISNMLAEMVCRGAGPLDARAHSEALDQLGVQRSTSVETEHFRLSATLLGQHLDEALPLLLDMILKPRLESASLDPSRALCLAAIDGLDDDPQHRTSVQLRKRFYPEPFGRTPLGERDHLQSMTLDQVRAFWQATAVPGGAILGIAGAFDPEKVREQVESLTGSWSGMATEASVVDDPPRGYEHHEAATEQVHMAIGYDAVAQPHEDSTVQAAAAAVLSGGMSGRLFTEVREKRGLCYAVMARYAGGKRFGAILGYAGTTTARAQQTLDVMTAELRRLSEGVDRDEFERALVGMKSRLVMQGESTSARALAISADQFVLGRPRSLDQMQQEVEAVTFDRLNDFVQANPPGPMTVVTIGPEALTPPNGSSSKP